MVRRSSSVPRTYTGASTSRRVSRTRSRVVGAPGKPKGVQQGLARGRQAILSGLPAVRGQEQVGVLQPHGDATGPVLHFQRVASSHHGAPPSGASRRCRSSDQTSTPTSHQTLGRPVTAAGEGCAVFASPSSSTRPIAALLTRAVGVLATEMASRSRKARRETARPRARIPPGTGIPATAARSAGAAAGKGGRGRRPRCPAALRFSPPDGSLKRVRASANGMLSPTQRPPRRSRTLAISASRCGAGGADA